MDKAKKFLLIALFTLFPLMTVLCEYTEVSAAEPQKGVFRIAYHFAFAGEWFDPSIGGPMTSRHPVLYAIHDALVKPMPNVLQQPCVAESYTNSADFKVFEFTVRKGVKFHNGDEVTAEDVVFTFQRYQGEGAAIIKANTEKVEALDRYRVRITFKEPFVTFMEYFIPVAGTVGWVVPKRYIEKVGDAGFLEKPIGCGPYRVVEFSPGIKLVLEAFDGYYGKKPQVKRIEFLFVKEKATRYAMLTRGEIDYALILDDVFYQRIQNDPKIKIANPNSPSRWFVHIGPQYDPKSPWSDPRVRKAASLAIDRKPLLDLYYPGGLPIGSSLSFPFDDQTPYYPPDPYDVAQAKKLMAEAGYGKGFHGGELYPEAGSWELGEGIATYFKALGITLDIKQLERAAWFSKRRAGQMKGALTVEALAQPTISSRLDYLLGPLGFGIYPELVPLWERYKKSVDPKVRKELLASIAKIMYDKTIAVGIFQSNAPSGMGPRIKGDPNNIQKPLPLLWFPAPYEYIELNE